MTNSCAAAVIKVKNLRVEVLVDIDVFLDAKRAIVSLQNNEVAPALAWCVENKSWRKKSKSKLVWSLMASRGTLSAACTSPPRILLAGKKVMQITLGRSPADEAKTCLQKLSKLLQGDSGLLLTNLTRVDMKRLF